MSFTAGPPVRGSRPASPAPPTTIGCFQPSSFRLAATASTAWSFSRGLRSKGLTRSMAKDRLAWRQRIPGFTPASKVLSQSGCESVPTTNQQDAESASSVGARPITGLFNQST
jgi:hypothetical protein